LRCIVGDNSSTASLSSYRCPAPNGQLYGEPLVADGRVIAATENNTVYVMAARSGRILWSRHLAKPVPSSDLPCGDISPEVGITGTPVIDLKRNEIFVDADTLIKGPSASRGVEASHRLFGLNLLTGKVELDEQATPNAGEDELAQPQRPGLALDHGRVVIAYGQNIGDCPGPNGPARGYVVSIPEQGGRLHYFQIGRRKDRGRSGWAAALRSSTLAGTSTSRALTATTRRGLARSKPAAKAAAWSAPHRRRSPQHSRGTWSS
jgi:hypothetical protein